MRRRKINETAKCYASDLWGYDVQVNDQSTSEVDTRRGDGGGEGRDYLLVTVIIKQAGFYGSQQQCEIEINANSDLLKALDKERQRGKDATKLLLNSLSKAVISAVVPLVS